MRDFNQFYLAVSVRWKPTGKPEFPYKAIVDGEVWTVRVNDFPVEELYTLIIDGQEMVEFNDWPKAWKR